MGKLKERLAARLEKRRNKEYTPIVLRAEDPIKWEVTYWRLLGIVSEGREIARQISASPTVKEFGECVFCIFTPEGEAIGFSRGILLHMASMGVAIQWMYNMDYEDDPGFKDGDIFFNNDPNIGGAHSADQALLLPIFKNGELIAWIGGLTHCMEVGSTEPGAQAPSALTRYDDGQMIPCLRVGENDKFYRDFHVMIDRNVRDGKWWILDDKAKLAGCLKMKESLLALVDEIGLDYFNTIMYEMLEEGRRSAVNKFAKVMFPGTYRCSTFYDIPNGDPIQRCRIPEDVIEHTPLEMTVEADGHIIVDWDGVSAPGYHANNASFPCSLGNHIYAFLQDVVYDGMFNNGLEDSFELKIPENSYTNPDKEFACCAWEAAVQSMSALSQCISNSYYTMGYREEGISSQAMTGCLFAGGKDQYGNQFSVMNFEMTCSGMGAQSNLDGLHASHACWNPEANIADCEMLEHAWPLLWLGRGILKDGGGFGRKQGGSSVSSLYVVEHVDQLESGSYGSNDYTVWNGMMGGYPAPARYRYCVIDTDYKERVDKQLPLPHGEGDDPTNPDFVKYLNGKLVRYPGQMSSDRFKRYSVLFMPGGGGGGWGDPLARDPEAVIYDIKMDFTSEWTAKNVYGIVWDPDTMKVDYAATEAKRQEMKNQRLQRGIPTKEYYEKERAKVLAGDIPPIPKKCLNECLKRSEKFMKEYREFWQLDDSFQGL
ncbi:MAG: hydantoinase B/oxoprolinase family protein [Syntrophomonadaceae bacterium]|jgi:acetone carboxylase alpha subunit